MKRWIGGLVLLLAVNMLHAQTTVFQPELTFGLNGGVTFSSVGFHPRVPQEMLLQQSGGLTVRYLSEKHFGLQLELNYSMRGWKEQTDDVVHFNQYTRSLSYLELPFMTHVYFDLGKHARLIFNAGPQIGYFLHEKELEKEIMAIPEKNYYNQPVQRKFDYGLTGGMGLEARTGIGSFILEGRYYFGFSDLFYNGAGDLFQSSHNQIIGVKLSYLRKF